LKLIIPFLFVFLGTSNLFSANDHTFQELLKTKLTYSKESSIIKIDKILENIEFVFLEPKRYNDKYMIIANNLYTLPEQIKRIKAVDDVLYHRIQTNLKSFSKTTIIFLHKLDTNDKANYPKYVIFSEDIEYFKILGEQLKSDIYKLQDIEDKIMEELVQEAPEDIE
jgi:hypothetical protein